MNIYAGGKRMYDGQSPELDGSQRKTIKIGRNSSSDDDTRYRILCPDTKVGALIGKGGATIKALKFQCKATIRIEDEVSGSNERVIYICSPSKKDPMLPLSVCPAQEALMRVHAHIAADDNGEIPRFVTARLLIPHIQIGCLIGRKSKIINQLRCDIPCQINILPKRQLPACAVESDELMQFVGDPVLVENVLRVVSSYLYKNPLHKRKGFQGHTNNPGISNGGCKSCANGESLLAPLPLAASVSGIGGHPRFQSVRSSGPTPPMGVIPGSVECEPEEKLTLEMLCPNDKTNKLIGKKAGAVRKFHHKSQAGIQVCNLASGDDKPTSPMGAVPHCVESEPVEELTLRMLCPNDKIGKVIGRKGGVIKDFCQKSQTRIQICDRAPGDTECIIEITSTEIMDSFVSRGIGAVMLVHQHLVDVQIGEDNDANVFIVRLLVPKKNIGCLLGKRGMIINELRNITKATIKILPESNLPKCMNKNEGLVQIMGDRYVVRDAFLQILWRLRANLFKGYKGLRPPILDTGYCATNGLTCGYGEGRFDADSHAGGTYFYGVSPIGEWLRFAAMLSRYGRTHS